MTGVIFGGSCCSLLGGFVDAASAFEWGRGRSGLRARFPMQAMATSVRAVVSGGCCGGPFGLPMEAAWGRKAHGKSRRPRQSGHRRKNLRGNGHCMKILTLRSRCIGFEDSRQRHGVVSLSEISVKARHISVKYIA